MNKQMINELRAELNTETAEQAEARKRLIEVETSESCVCSKCAEPTRCEHDVVDVHEAVLSNCCI